MIYLDSGCLVKLYYPEPDSHLVAARVTGNTLCFSPLHELEITSALQQKVFRGQATPAQVTAAAALIASDLSSGILQRMNVPWDTVYQDAISLTEHHTADTGCRSLDTLHCALALAAGARDFISTDARQIQVAQAIGLPFTPLGPS